jgi:hypothetical protein
MIRLGHWLVYWIGRSAVAIAALLPQWLGYRPRRCSAGLLRCSPRRRAARCASWGAFPAATVAERLRLGAISTGNVFKVPLDMARLTRLLARGGDLRAVVDTSALDGLLPSPPYLALTAHLGSWEVGAVTMAQVSGGAHGVARVFRNPLLQRWILRNRRRGSTSRVAAASGLTRRWRPAPSACRSSTSTSGCAAWSRRSSARTPAASARRRAWHCATATRWWSAMRSGSATASGSRWCRTRHSCRSRPTTAPLTSGARSPRSTVVSKS